MDYRAVTVWKQVDNWLYEYFERDIAPETLEGFEDIVRIWQEKRGDRPAPALADIKFSDFPGWHGRIVLCDFFYDPFDYKYRLVGTDVAARIGADYTGRRLSELVADGLSPVGDFEFYEMAGRKMLIVRASGSLGWSNRQHQTATFAEFPLSDDGEKATHLLSAMI